LAVPVTVLALALLVHAVPAVAGTISTMDGLSLTLTADGRVSAVAVGGDNLTVQPSPAIRIRDLTSAGTTFAPNLVANASFEVDADNNGLPDGWSLLPANNSLTIVRSSLQRIDGNFSMLFDVDGGNGDTVGLSSDAFAVTPGLTYRLSAQMKAGGGYLSEQHTNLDWQCDFYLGTAAAAATGIFVRWFDDQGVQLALQAVTPLHADANNWKRITGEVVAPANAHSARFVVGVKIRRRPSGSNKPEAAEKLWVDDVSMIAAPELDTAVPGTVTSTASTTLVFDGDLAAAGLHVQTTYRALADRLEIDGHVDDSTGADRSLEVVVRFPADLTGYDWWDDIETKRVVAVGQAYGNVISATVTGMLPMSLYPLAALTDPAHGLAAALPMDSPQVATLRFVDGALEARFAVAISPAAPRLASSASFRLSLFTFDPTAGFRGAFSEFVVMHPAWFSSPRDLFAFSAFHRGNFANLNCALSDPSCDLNIVAADDLNGDATGEYNLPEGLMQVGAATLPPPPYGDILAQVFDSTSGPRFQAMAASLTLGGNGDPALKAVRIPGNSPDFWSADWVLNMDPEIQNPKGYARWIRDTRVDPAFTDTDNAGLHLDGLFLDNFMSAPLVDLDPSHLAIADTTLTFDPATYRPGVHTQASVFEFLAWLRDDVDTKFGADRGFSTNTWGLGTINALVPFVDGLFNEGSPTKGVNWSDSTLRYRRTMAYHKIAAFTDQDAGLDQAGARAFAQEAIFYGIGPREGPKSDTWTQAALDEVSQARTLVRRYDKLGWEPVTHGVLSDPTLRVERFGDDVSQQIDFTVYNAGGSDAPYTLTIDTAALGVPAIPDLRVQDVLSGRLLPYTDIGSGQIAVASTVPPVTTQVVRVAGGVCTPVERTTVKVTFRDAVGDDKMIENGRFMPVSGVPDIVGETVTFSIADMDGEIYQVAVPAGGFIANSKQTVFKFKAPTPTPADGLVSARFSQRHDGSFKWKAKVRGVDLSGADRPDMNVEVLVGPGCFSADLPCESRSAGRKRRCRQPR